VRWALLLAIDIADYMGIAVDGTGALSPVHIPSLSNYPADFISRCCRGWKSSRLTSATAKPSSRSM
jgi:hypothetical protein